MSVKNEKIEVFNINKIGTSAFVQKDKYDEVKKVLIEFMPHESPGLTQDEMASLVIAKVSHKIFEDRSKAGWWMKTVQLDLEARQVMIREKTKPTRWYYNPSKKEVAPVVLKPKEILKKPVLKLSDRIKNRLLTENVLKEYEERPFYQRNDYIHWIESAKREETFEKRIQQMIDELKDGNTYMKMEYSKGKS